MMDHNNHQRLQEAELTDAVLTGATIYGPADETIGLISHLHGSGSSAMAVIDVGGFLGIGSKPVQLPVSALQMMRDEAGTVHGVRKHSKDELKDLPEHHD